MKKTTIIHPKYTKIVFQPKKKEWNTFKYTMWGFDYAFYLSILLSFDIDNESRLPFFIADGADDCPIAVEFRRFTVNALLLATCKAALALRRRGGDSVELPNFQEL